MDEQQRKSETPEQRQRRRFLRRLKCPEQRSRIVEAVSKGLPIKDILEDEGTCQTQYWAKLASDPEFSRQIEIAHNRALNGLEDKVMDAAINGPDAKFSLSVLERKRPHKWAKRNPEQLTPEQFGNLIEHLIARLCLRLPVEYHIALVQESDALIAEWREISNVDPNTTIDVQPESAAEFVSRPSDPSEVYFVDGETDQDDDATPRDADDRLF